MFRKMFVLLIFSVLAVLPSSAQVIMPPPPIGGGMATNPDWLSVDFHRVNVMIDEQIATTNVEMQFTNNGEIMAEGTFLFPLPKGATVENLTMFINGEAIEAQILRADEARAVYDEIVRQYRDPALLEYVGRDLLQASVFPIPPKETRKIEIRYGQVLELDNGLLNYSYPLNSNPNTSRMVKQMSIRVEVTDNDALTNVYSPSHTIALSRPSQNRFVAGFEQNDFRAIEDFDLYFGLQRDSIDASLLTFKESASADGFFMLMIQPPMVLDNSKILPKDVVIVLDQSGSMAGGKWEQAQQASLYVLENLQPNDRFNVVVFSTGWRIYSETMLPANQAPGAMAWIKMLYAEGGTDIHGGLSTAFGYSDSERTLNVIFLTDGLATEGITYTPDILASLEQIAPSNLRLFSFGVGDDVDTILLDSLVEKFNGVSLYVRPNERIDEEVASLYNKISAPVMSDISLTFDGVTVESVYPQVLTDLFAGEQLTLVGRYRKGAENATITLTGKQDGEIQTIVYDDLRFDDRAGGTEFVARLWATRRIGDLLNQIRLRGENKELVDSVVSLSIRYGIITPYTSFLITEDDILSQAGRENANQLFEQEAQNNLANAVTGSGAVSAADMAQNMARSSAPQQGMPPVAPMVMPAATQTMQQSTGGGIGNMAPPPPSGAPAEENFAAPQVNLMQQVGSKNFVQQNAIWTDSEFQPDTMTPVQVVFLSDEYFDLLAQYPEIAPYLAIDDEVIVVIEGIAYQVVVQ